MDLPGVLRWLEERWAPSGGPPTTAVIVILAVVAVCILVRPAWLVTRHAATVVHEMGHVSVAFLMRRRISGIKLHTDSSGVTVSRGKPRGPGVLLTALAGYTAPTVLGTALVLVAMRGWAGIAVTAIILMLALALLLARNLFGFVVSAVLLAAAGYVFWTGDAAAMVLVSLGVGLFLVGAGVRDAFGLRRIHRAGRGGTTDATVAGRNSFLRPGAWVWFFILISLAGAVLCLWALGLWEPGLAEPGLPGSAAAVFLPG